MSFNFVAEWCLSLARLARRASFETRPPGAPQDEVSFDVIKEEPHPEEAAKRPSRRTHDNPGTKLRQRGLAGPRRGQATTRSATMTLPLVSGPKTSPRVQHPAPTQAPISIGIANP